MSGRVAEYLDPHALMLFRGTASSVENETAGAFVDQFGVRHPGKSALRVFKLHEDDTLSPLFHSPFMPDYFPDTLAQLTNMRRSKADNVSREATHTRVILRLAHLMFSARDSCPLRNTAGNHWYYLSSESEGYMLALNEVRGSREAREAAHGNEPVIRFYLWLIVNKGDIPIGKIDLFERNRQRDTHRRIRYARERFHYYVEYLAKFQSGRPTLQRINDQYEIESTMALILLDEWLMVGVSRAKYEARITTMPDSDQLDDNTMVLADKHEWIGDNTMRYVQHACVIAFV
jgi:hypothetical protein